MNDSKKAVVNLDIGTLEGKEQDGLFVFTKQNLLKLKLESILFEKRDMIFSIQIGGGITPLIGGFGWPEFDIKALTIDSTGRVEIDGGWIDLPDQLSMDFYGFELQVSKIGFGKDENKWIGFSGGLILGAGIMKFLCW